MTYLFRLCGDCKRATMRPATHRIFVRTSLTRPVSTTFSPHHLVPEGRAMLAFSCVLPDTWVQGPPSAEDYALANPAVFIPLVVCMAPCVR